MNPVGDGTQLDTMSAREIAELLLRAEERVVPAVWRALPEVVTAATVLAECVRRGGRLVFAGAGTSGRIAAAEAAELPGTFGLERHRVIAVLAGARSADGSDADEDDVVAARRDMDDLQLADTDVVVAVAVSGRTPYTLVAAECATGAGAQLIAVVCADGTPLGELAHVAVVVPVGAEILRGSTRLSAGTAQKIALNAITTAAMSLAGRVHGDVMIDVVPANLKLRDRVVAMVAEIAGCDAAAAHQALQECRWNARAAVVYLVLGLDAPQALARVQAHRTLREALVPDR